MTTRTLGIDLACRADHLATLADERGEIVFANRRLRSTKEDLDVLLVAAGGGGGLTVVLEPTRNAWVPVAAHLMAAGAKVVVVPPEQSADLRRYYSKHAKTDGLDSKMLARLPLLHPEGLVALDNLGPADALKRAVRRRAALVDDRVAAGQRLDCLLELFGPGFASAFGAHDAGKATLVVLERFGDPRDLRRFGRSRLTALLIKASRGQWREAKADELLAAAGAAIELWAGGGLDFADLGWDIASQVRLVVGLDTEIARLEERIATLYANADREGIVRSAPGFGPTLAGGVLGRLGDARRFANLAAVRSFSGMVPATNQSGTSESKAKMTKAGDAGLRRDLFLAADIARRTDPQLAAKYYDLVVHRGHHHTSAVCHVATTLLTRVAACWRAGETYVLRDIDHWPITGAEGRAIVAEHYKIPAEVRRARRTTSDAKTIKGRAGRRNERSQNASTLDPPTRPEPIENLARIA